MTFVHRMNDLMSGDGHIKNLSTRDEPLLTQTDKRVKKGFESIDQDFGEDLVDNIAKADWAKVFQRRRILNFGDQSNEGV